MLQRTRLTIVTATLTATALAGVIGVVAPSAQTVPRSPSAFISVLDLTGAPVSNLDVSQVSMTVDGAACAPLRLEAIDWPTRLAVLVDNSGASLEWFSTLRESLRRFLFEVPEGVQTSLVTLAPQPRWIVRPTDERADFWRGIDLIIPDRGGAKFVEGIGEAADRIEQQTTDAFWTIMIITTNGTETSGGDLQRIFDRLHAQVLRRPVTIHVVMLAVSDQKANLTSAGEAIAPGTPTVSLQSGTVSAGQPVPATAGVSASAVTLKTSGALQTQIGLALTKETGGRYEGIAVPSNLLTLLPEFGRRIARSYEAQRNQYRISCDQSMPVMKQLSVYTSYPGARGVFLSRDGRVP